MGTKKTVEEMVEGLAIAVQHGFEGVGEEMRGIIKEELREVRGDVKEIKDRLAGVEKELVKVKFNSSDLGARISTLEQKMQIVSAKLGFQ